jgi:hypothetical protein
MFEIYESQRCIIAANSGLAVDIGKDRKRGPNIIQWRYHGGANQRWDYDSQSRILRCRDGGLVLDVKGGIVRQGATLIGAPETSSTTQRWVIVDAMDARKEFKSSAPVYDVRPGFATSASARPAFAQWGCTCNENYQGPI